jgi:hypothetical protein
LTDIIVGLELARLADLPTDVLAEGQRVATTLATRLAQQKARSQATRITERRKGLLKVVPFLLFLLLVHVSSYSFIPSLTLDPGLPH